MNIGKSIKKNTYTMLNYQIERPIHNKIYGEEIHINSEVNLRVRIPTLKIRHIGDLIIRNLIRDLKNRLDGNR